MTALPGAVAASGFLGGNALILCVGVVSGWTLSCLCACAKRSGCESYPVPWRGTASGACAFPDASAVLHDVGNT